MRGGRLLVHRQGSHLLQRPRRVRPPHRPEPGHPVPDRGELHGDRGGESDALQGLRALRREKALRCRSEHGEAPLRQGFMGSGQRVPADAWRLRLRRRIRRGTQIQGDPALSRGADLHQPHPLLSRRARARPAPLLLACATSRPGSTASTCTTWRTDRARWSSCCTASRSSGGRGATRSTLWCAPATASSPPTSAATTTPTSMALTTSTRWYPTFARSSITPASARRSSSATTGAAPSRGILPPPSP